MGWLTGWNNRKSKSISGVAAGVQADYQMMTVKVHRTIGTDTPSGDNETIQHVYVGDHALSTLGDVRFTASDGDTLLPYWMKDIVSNPYKFEDFTKYVGNPLTSIPKYAASGVVHPGVLYFSAGKDGYKYWMLYTPYPDNEDENPSIVRSNDGTTWVDTGITNPVIADGGAGEWNAFHNHDPDMLYVDAYSKWFMVWGGVDVDLGSFKIALAYSTDGKTWTEYDGVAINGNTDPVILNGEDTGGVAWELEGADSTIYTPTLIYRDGTFYLYYASQGTGYANNRGKVGYATFTWNNTTNDVENFQRYASNPVIDLAQDGTFKSGCGHIDISYYDGTYYLYVIREILAGSIFEMALLTSTDKVTWTYVGRVLERSASEAWDDRHVYRGGPATDGEGTVVLFDSTLRLFYSGYRISTGYPRIGLATGGEDYADFIVKVPQIPVTGTTIYCYYGKAGEATTSNHLTAMVKADDGATGNFDEDVSGTASLSHVAGNYKFTEDSIDDAFASGKVLTDLNHRTIIESFDEFEGRPTENDQIMFGLFDEDVISQLCGESGVVGSKRRFLLQRHSSNGDFANKIMVIYMATDDTFYYWTGLAWDASAQRHSVSGAVELRLWASATTLYLDVLNNVGISIFTSPASIAISSVKAFSSGKCLSLTDLYTNAICGTGTLSDYYIRKYVDPEPAWGATGAEEQQASSRPWTSILGLKSKVAHTPHIYKTRPR